jgi:predicted HTH transcriptional regulator
MTETSRIEYKQELTDFLEKEVIAFLNSHEGGVIYLGIDKSGKVLGLDNSDADQLKIKDRLKNNIQPSCLGLFDVIHENREGKAIIKIMVAGGLEKPYYLKKYGMSERGCFIRIGSASEPMPGEMIESLYSKRVRNTIGKMESPRHDLTFEQLFIYYESKGLKLNNAFMKNLELLTSDGKPNYAAYLLADENGVSLQVAKYSGTDRVEITSMGGLPYGVDKEDFFSGFSVPRNKELMRVFRDLEIVEQLGSGIPRILKKYGKEAFEIRKTLLRVTMPYAKPFETREKIPTIYEIPKIIGGKVAEEVAENFGKKVGGQIGGQIDLTKREREVLSLIGQDNKITRKSLAKNLNINESAVSKHLDNLKNKGLIKRIDGTRGHWEVLDK